LEAGARAYDPSPRAALRILSRLRLAPKRSALRCFSPRTSLRMRRAPRRGALPRDAPRGGRRRKDRAVACARAGLGSSPDTVRKATGAGRLFRGFRAHGSRSAKLREKTNRKDRTWAISSAAARFRRRYCPRRTPIRRLLPDPPSQVGMLSHPQWRLPLPHTRCATR
jgi:hypothetical protein